MVLGNPFRCRTDEADPALFEVGQTPEIVVNLQCFGIGEQGVDGEVAPRRVLPPVLAEHHRRPPPVGRHIAAQRGYLDRPVGQHGGHRAMVDAGGNNLDRRSGQPVRYIFRHQRCGDIYILDRNAQQAVAHGPSDKARLPVERRDQGGEAASLCPVHRWQFHGSQPSLFPRLFKIPAVIPQIR